MILSQTAVYAVKATLYLAEMPGEGPVTVEDIAGALDVPRNYLSKILSALGHSGVLTATRGRTGGFSMGRPAANVTLAQVIAPFDDIGGAPVCILGNERCHDATPCAAHARWKAISASVRAFLDGTTIHDLTRGGPPSRPADLIATPL